MKLYKYTDGRANASGQKIKGAPRGCRTISGRTRGPAPARRAEPKPKGNKPDRNRRARRARLRAALLLEGAKRANLRAAAC